MKRAIVIDDDHDIVQVFSEMLQMIGFDVIACGYDGTDAIKFHETNKPDIIFMDVHMTKLDGERALMQIRKKDSETKIIMVTGDLSQNLEKRLEQYGASAIIHKPFDIQKIQCVLGELEKATTMIVQKL